MARDTLPAAVAASDDDVVIVHVLSHGETHQDDVRVGTANPHVAVDFPPFQSWAADARRLLD